MKLQCIVEVPLNATEITIGWFLNCEQLNNGSHVGIEALVQPASEVRRISSHLTISDLTDDSAGEYMCNILGDEEYIPCNPFDLKDRDFLEVELALEGSCVDGQVFNPDIGEKCAVITEENPIPMSLVCDVPPATSSQILPSSSTPFVSTTSPHLSSSSTPSLTQTTHPTPSDSSVSLPSPTDPGVSTTTASTRENTTSIWLYVVVAVAAVFFMIIVVLAIVPVGMWVWRNKGIDNQRPNRESCVCVCVCVCVHVYVHTFVFVCVVLLTCMGRIRVANLHVGHYILGKFYDLCMCNAYHVFILWSVNYLQLSPLCGIIVRERGSVCI